MYWITSKGIDYLTEIIDKAPSRHTNEDTRRQDLLGILESRGGGYSAEQLVSFLERRPIERPLVGSRSQYLDTLESLERGRYVEELGEEGDWSAANKFWGKKAPYGGK